MELSRRSLLKAGLAGGAGAALLQIPRMVPGGPQTVDQMAAMDLHRDQPEEWLPSVCAACASACPLTLRRVGSHIVGVRPLPPAPPPQRAITPLTPPLSRGGEGLCARAYTIPQELVHPDRVRTPLKRTGARGKGAFQPLPLDVALTEIADILRRSGTKTAVVVRESAALSFALLKALGQAIGAAHVLTEEWAWSQGPVDALEQATGWRHWGYDLANADGVLSFGWDWLQAHPHPAEAHKAFARLREKGAPLFFVGPRFNLTAMRSHEWIACRAGFEPLVALSLAHILASGGMGAYGRGGGRDASRPHAYEGLDELARGLEKFDLADAERKTGVSARRLREVAETIADRGSPLCLGARGRLQDQWAVVALNALLGNIGKDTGGLTPAPDCGFEISDFGFYSAICNPQSAIQLEELPEAVARGRDVEALILVGVNPAFASPAPARWRDGLKRARHVVCLTTFMDETAAFADIVLPLALPAERQDAYLMVPVSASGVREDPGAQPAARNPQPIIVEPAVPPPADVLSPVAFALELARRLEVPQGVFPWQTLTDAAHEVVVRPPDISAVRIPQSAVEWMPPQFTEGKFHLMLETPVTLPRAEGAHLPYLLTTVGPHLREWWTTWVEVNPETAERLHLHNRDEVIVESRAGAIRARVKTFPGVPPDAVCMALGVGHRIGQFAQREGGNPMELLEWRQDEETRVPLWNAQRVNIRRANA